MELVDALPEKTDVNEFIETVISNAKVEMAMEQVARGEILTSEELDKEIDGWN